MFTIGILHSISIDKCSTGEPFGRCVYNTLSFIIIDSVGLGGMVGIRGGVEMNNIMVWFTMGRGAGKGFSIPMICLYPSFVFNSCLLSFFIFYF